MYTQIHNPHGESSVRGASRLLGCALLTLALIFPSLAQGAPAIRETTKITIATYDYPPLLEDRADKGLTGDLVVAAFKAAGMDAELRFYPVARMADRVSQDQVVGAVGAIEIFQAPEVRRSIRSMEMIHYVPTVFFYDDRKYPEGITFKTLDDMQKYRIGALNASGVFRFLTLAGGLTLEPAVANESSAQQLALRRIDLWAASDLAGQATLQTLFPGEITHYPHTRAFNVGEIFVAFSRKLDPDGEIGRRFRSGLATIKADGTYMNIMAKYYGGKSRINAEALPQDMRRRH